MKKFVVAVKDVSTGEIRSGKVLSEFRSKEFAEKARVTLARKESLDIWKVGIFLDGKCLH
jgi:hypothetical protein